MEIPQDEARRIAENQLREEGRQWERERRAATRRTGARVIIASAVGAFLSFGVMDLTKYAVASTLIGIAVATTMTAFEED